MNRPQRTVHLLIWAVGGPLLLTAIVLLILAAPGAAP